MVTRWSWHGCDKYVVCVRYSYALSLLIDIKSSIRSTIHLVGMAHAHQSSNLEGSYATSNSMTGSGQYWSSNQFPPFLPFPPPPLVTYIQNVRMYLCCCVLFHQLVSLGYSVPLLFTGKRESEQMGWDRKKVGRKTGGWFQLAKIAHNHTATFVLIKFPSARHTVWPLPSPMCQPLHIYLCIAVALLQVYNNVKVGAGMQI